MATAVKILALAFATSAITGQARCLEGTSGPELVEQRHYDLSGQTHVVTGGDSGIGSGVVMSLAKANARVILLGHDMEKTAQWMKHVSDVTGNDKLSAIAINQFSLASVKDAVDELLAKTDRIDVVVGNAGTDVELAFLTKDGFNAAFELQYISHFYMVELLLPKLRESRGRVVFTSAAALDPYGPQFCGIVGNDFNTISQFGGQSGISFGCEALANMDAVSHSLNTMGGSYFSYFAKTMYMRHLAIREKDIMAFSFQPGAVQSPGLSKSMSTKGTIELCQSIPYEGCLCGKNITCPLNGFQGAVSPVYLAAAPAEELWNIDGSITVLCGWNPYDPQSGYLDPYDSMVNRIGFESVQAYLDQLQAMSWAWVNEAGVIKAASAGTKVDATLPNYAAVLVIGALLGFFAAWTKTRLVASDKNDPEYALLAGAQ